MSDLALQWDPESFSADLRVVSNDLATDDGLRTAAILSLFTDAPARAGDVLPDGTIARGGEGGWWANGAPVVEGDVWGSRLWLLKRAKKTPDVLVRAPDYAREGLAWMVSDRVALTVEATAEFIEAPTGWAVAVQIFRPNGDPVGFRFGKAWAAEELRILE